MKNFTAFEEYWFIQRYLQRPRGITIECEKSRISEKTD